MLMLSKLMNQAEITNVIPKSCASVDYYLLYVFYHGLVMLFYVARHMIISGICLWHFVIGRVCGYSHR